MAQASDGNSPPEERYATIATELASGIEESLHLLRDVFRSPEESHSPIINREELLYFAVCAVSSLIFSVSGAKDPVGLADAMVVRALNLTRGSDASVRVAREYRSRFDQYRPGFLRFFSKPEDYDHLLSDALVNIVGRKDSVDVTIFGGYFVILVAEAGRSMKS